MQMSTQRWIFALLVTALLASASTASADELYLEVHGHLEGTDGVQQTLADREVITGPAVLLGIEPEALSGLRLMAGLSDDTFNHGSHFNGQLASDWQRTRVMAKADWGVDVFGDTVRPMIRMGVGYSYQRLELATSDATYRGTDHGVSAMAAAGLESRYQLGGDEDTQGRVSLGANALVGYAWNSRADFDEMETTENVEDSSWERSGYDAGSMRSAGVTFSVGVNLRYRFGR